MSKRSFKEDSTYFSGYKGILYYVLHDANEEVGTLAKWELEFPLWCAFAFSFFTDKKNVLYFSFVLKSSHSSSWITFSNDFHVLLYYDALFFFNWFTTIN